MKYGEGGYIPPGMGAYACPKVVGWCGAGVYERNWNSGFCWQSHFDENLLWQPTGSCKGLSKLSTAFHYTCPALDNCKSMSKCDEKHLRCNLPCQVLSIVGLDTFMHVVGTDLQLVHVWVHFIARYYIFLVR